MTNRGIIAAMKDSEYPVPCYSKNKVVKAGEALRGKLVTGEVTPEIVEIFRAAYNWRDAHAYPMRRIRFELAAKAKRVHAKGITAARLKRMQSIRKKLRRINSTLVQIQDLGGCRAILYSMAD
jgi:hypothetical protein